MASNGYDQYGNRWIDYGGGNHNLSFSTSTNRITTSGFSYDAVGNLTNDTIHSYTFDAENKVSKVDNVSAYVYDGEGQRVRKLVGENLRFIYDMHGQQVAEFDGSSGALKKEYVYGASGLVATVEPTAVNANGTRYTMSDNLGTPRVITNSSAAVVSRHDYMPFGQELGAGVGGRTNGIGFIVADGVRQRFTQKERDNETGLDYFMARYYSSAEGRFTSVDPVSAVNYQQTYNRSKELRDFRKFLRRLENPQTWNMYTYSVNNPLSFVDPNGEETVTTPAEVDEAIRKRKLENQRAQLTDYAKELARDIKKGKLSSKDAIDKFFDKAKDLTGNNTASALLIATGSALDLRSSVNLEGTRQNIGSRITEGSLGQDTLHHFFINAFNNYENPLLGGVITAVATRQETDPEDRFADRQGARFGELLAEPPWDRSKPKREVQSRISRRLPLHVLPRPSEAKLCHPVSFWRLQARIKERCKKDCF